MKIKFALVFTLGLIAASSLGAQEPGKYVYSRGTPATPTAANDYVNRQLPMVRMSGLLRLDATIPLPTTGYMDHLAYDLKGHHLFISGEASHEVVVVDMDSGKVIHVTKLPSAPRKPFFDAALNQLWVDLGDNTAVALDGNTFAVVKTVAFTGGANDANRDADNAAYDPVKHLYYAAVRNKLKGTDTGSIEIVDTRAAKLAGRIPIHADEPAGIAFDPAGHRLYAGIGDVVNGVSIVKVIDTAARKIIAEWPITGGPQPHVAALDVAHHRLFLGSRLGGGHTTEPGKLVVLDTDTGKMVQVLDAPGGGDEIFYDDASGRIYFAGATGTVWVYHEDNPSHFRLLGAVPTGAIAKSGIWIPELKRYYAAVPAHLIVMLPLTVYGVHDWVTEPAHLMQFQQIP